MPKESTQYGLKNKLFLADYKELANNHIQVWCQRDTRSVILSPEDEGSQARSGDPSPSAQDDIYLNILFLSPQIIRFHYSSDENFKLNYPNDDLDWHNFDLSQKHYSNITFNQDFLSIKHPEGEVLIYRKALQILIYDKENNLIDSDEASLGYWSNGKEVRCYKQYQELEKPPQIFGLGDKTGVLNRWGKRFRNAPIDALGYDSEFTDPLYKDIPFFLVREQGNFHGIFFDNFYEKFFDLGRERKPSPYYYFGASGGELNYYFFYGDKPAEIISSYLKLTGRPPEHPEYTYGYLASGMIYTENDNKSLGHLDPGANLLTTFKRFKENQIPATAFHLSSGYIQDSNGQRQQFIWNPEKFPDPKAFAESARKEGVELCVNLKPVLLTSHPWYEEALEKDLFINRHCKHNNRHCKHNNRHCKHNNRHPERSEGSQARSKDPSVAPQDDSNARNDALVIDYWGGEGSIMDFRKPQTQNWWKEKIKTNFFDNGIFGIWNDNNEYEIFEKHSAEGYEHFMSNLMTKLSVEAYDEWINRHPENNNRHPENNNRHPERSEGSQACSRDSSATPQNDICNKRPWILSRSGYAGIQKYAQTWTGDNYSSWKALQYDIPLMSSMSLSGLIHVGDDIGGFWGGDFDTNPDPELLLRWIQFGVFTPRFCIHSYKQTPTEPDMYKDSHPEFFQIIQNFMALRTKLIPEIKESAKKASQEGVPIMRTTFYDFPDDEKTYEQNFEYIFADKYLVAPIYTAGAKTREVYLPGKGFDWTDYWTGEKYQAGQSIILKATKDNIPTFTRGTLS